MIRKNILKAKNIIGEYNAYELVNGAGEELLSSMLVEDPGLAYAIASVLMFGSLIEGGSALEFQLPTTQLAIENYPYARECVRKGGKIVLISEESWSGNGPASRYYVISARFGY